MIKRKTKRKSKTRRSRTYKKMRGGGITSTSLVRSRRTMLTDRARIAEEQARVAAIIEEGRARGAELEAREQALRQEREAREAAEEAAEEAAAEKERVKRCKKKDTIFKKNGISCGDKFNFWELMIKNNFTPIELTVTDMEIVDSIDGTRKIHRIFFEDTGGGEYDLEFPQFELYIKRFLNDLETFPQLQLITSKKSIKNLLNPLTTVSGNPFEDYVDDFDSDYTGKIPREYKTKIPSEYKTKKPNSTTV